MDPVRMENEEEGTEILTEQTLNCIQVADMIGSTLEEVCNIAEFERNEFLSIISAIDEYRENQDDNFILKAEADEKRKDEARAKVETKLSLLPHLYFDSEVKQYILMGYHKNRWSRPVSGCHRWSRVRVGFALCGCGGGPRVTISAHLFGYFRFCGAAGGTLMVPALVLNGEVPSSTSGVACGEGGGGG